MVRARLLEGGTGADPYGSLTPEYVFSHAGLGSSVGWAGPKLNTGLSYVTNGVREGTEHVAGMRPLANTVRLALQ